MIVVMTQREKIAMEALFRRTIPPHKRDGSHFVFRQVLFIPQPILCYPSYHPMRLLVGSSPSLSFQAISAWHGSNKEVGRQPGARGSKDASLFTLQGSPLVPADLKMVSASSAAATVIVSDTSRCVWGRHCPHTAGSAANLPIAQQTLVYLVYVQPFRNSMQPCHGSLWHCL